MKHYILRFLLIFACVSIPLHSNACWDDAWDDYYSYDDYDDDDWWDDDDDYDDLLDDDYSWWDDDDDDWDDNNNVDYGDVNDDDYDIDGGELDDVVVTPDYDWGLDDDWWRVDYSYEEEDNDDDDWYNDYDDENIGNYHPNNNKTTNGTNPPSLPNDIHKAEKYEKLFKENLPAKYPIQSCKFNCFTTVLAICNALMADDFKFKSYSTYLFGIETWFTNIFNRDICERGILHSEVYEFLTYGCNLIYDKISVNDIASCIDNGDLVMVTIPNGTHEVLVVGYYDDFGIDAYQCVNPGNGIYETHYDYEFDENLIIRYYKDN